VFLPWRHYRPPQRTGRVRCRPCLETLEDRCLLSSASAALSPLTNWAGVPISAYAGQTFSGVVATFSSPGVAGLTSTIAWDDGHVSPGGIAPVNGSSLVNQTFAISGTNTFAQAGSYSVIVSVVAAQGSMVTIQTPATVLPPPKMSSAGAAMAPSSLSVVIMSNGVSLSYTVPSGLPTGSTVFAPSVAPPVNLPVPPPAGGLQNPPAAVNPPAGQNQIPGQVQVIVPLRVVVTDYVAWSSTRDQGLNHPAVGSGTQPATDYIAWIDLSEHVGAGELVQVSQIIMPGPASSLPMVTVVVIAETHATARPPDKSVSAGFAATESVIPGPFETAVSTVGFTLTGREPLSVRPASEETEERGDAGQDVYHQPLYRIAERGELGGFGSISTPMTIASLATAAASAPADCPPPLPLERSRRPLEELEWLDRAPPHRLSDADAGAMAPASLVEAAAAWAILQALHARELPPLLVRPAAVPSRTAGTATNRAENDKAPW